MRWTYDLYVWDSAAVQPTIPFAANLIAVSYNLAQSILSYNKAYKWKVVSKNACLQTDGPVQYFRLKPLPDLVVSNVQVPAAAFSGQTITLNWRVTNTGPGNTSTNQTWTDAVFLSFDTVPDFNIPPNTSAGAWSQLDFPVRPLLIGTKPNVSALDSGQHYDNSINFTLPLNYSLPLYAYVITNYAAGNNPLLQMTYITDTAKAPQAIAVTLSPTPDLRVDTVFTPSSVFSGSTVNITYKVKNYGALTPSGSSWADKLYISQSPLFNINNATELMFVKPNGTYYSNAAPAVVMNNTQLQPDSFYTHSVQAVIPNFISGSYYIYMWCNATNSLYEGAAAGNNLNSNLLQVFLTPTPQLTINSLIVPVTTASSTQTIGVNWNVLNTGFTDNIEKNKGHFYIPQGVCSPNVLRLADSTSFGSSYWVDNIYLSTDPSGLNASAIFMGQAIHGISGSGAVADYAPAFKCVPTGTDPSSQNENISNIIKPGSNHPGTFNFTIPASFQVGSYYVYVKANAGQTVFEYPGTPQIRRSDLPISIQRPDVTVSASVPATGFSGQPVAISYSVLNNGAGAVYNSLRKDKIYVSASSVFDGSAQLIAEQTFTESLPVNTPVLHSLNYTFPSLVSGTRYFYIHTNYDSSFKESNSTNNISAPAAIALSTTTPVDLVVSAVPLADSIFTIYNTKIRYTVINNGIGTTNGSWVDSIFISCNAGYNEATSYYIGQRNHNEALAPGSSYNDSFIVNMPLSWMINACFPQTANTTAYFFVKTNAGNGVYEAGDNNNNITGSGARILVNPLVDHIVTNVTAGDTATVARSYPITWTVKNTGYMPDNNNYFSWQDVVYFSPDSVFNSNAVISTINYLNTRLDKNQSYTETKPAIPPVIPTGDYYVWIKTNAF